MDTTGTSGSSNIRPILIEPLKPVNDDSEVDRHARSFPPRDAIADVSSKPVGGSLYQLVDINVNGVIKKLKIPVISATKASASTPAGCSSTLFAPRSLSTSVRLQPEPRQGVLVSTVSRPGVQPQLYLRQNPVVSAVSLGENQQKHNCQQHPSLFSSAVPCDQVTRAVVHKAPVQVEPSVKFRKGHVSTNTTPSVASSVATSSSNNMNLKVRMVLNSAPVRTQTVLLPKNILNCNSNQNVRQNLIIPVTGVSTRVLTRPVLKAVRQPQQRVGLISGICTAQPNSRWASTNPMMRMVNERMAVPYFGVVLNKQNHPDTIKQASNLNNTTKTVNSQNIDNNLIGIRSVCRVTSKEGLNTTVSNSILSLSGGSVPNSTQVSTDHMRPGISFASATDSVVNPLAKNIIEIIPEDVCLSKPQTSTRIRPANTSFKDRLLIQKRIDGRKATTVCHRSKSPNDNYHRTALGIGSPYQLYMASTSTPLYVNGRPVYPVQNQTVLQNSVPRFRTPIFSKLRLPSTQNLLRPTRNQDLNNKQKQQRTLPIVGLASDEDRLTLDSILLCLVNRHVKSSSCLQSKRRPDEEGSPNSMNSDNDDFGLVYETTGDDCLMDFDDDRTSNSSTDTCLSRASNKDRKSSISTENGNADSNPQSSNSTETGLSDCTNNERRWSSPERARSPILTRASKRACLEMSQCATPPKKSKLKRNTKKTTRTSRSVKVSENLSSSISKNAEALCIATKKLDVATHQETRTCDVVDSHGEVESVEDICKSIINDIIYDVVGRQNWSLECDNKLNSDSLSRRSTPVKKSISQYDKHEIRSTHSNDVNSSSTNQQSQSKTTHISRYESKEDTNEKDVQTRVDMTSPSIPISEEVNSSEKDEYSDLFYFMASEQDKNSYEEASLNRSFRDSMSPVSCMLHSGEEERSPEHYTKNSAKHGSIDAQQNDANKHGSLNNKINTNNRGFSSTLGCKSSVRLQEKTRRIESKNHCRGLNCFGCTDFKTRIRQQKSSVYKCSQSKEFRQQRKLLFKTYKRFFPYLKDCFVKVYQLPCKCGLFEGNYLDLSIYDVHPNGKIISKTDTSSKSRKSAKVTGHRTIQPSAVSNTSTSLSSSKDKYLMITTSRGTYLVPADGDGNKQAMIVGSESGGSNQSSNARLRIIADWKSAVLRKNDVILKEALRGAAGTSSGDCVTGPQTQESKTNEVSAKSSQPVGNNANSSLSPRDLVLEEVIKKEPVDSQTPVSTNNTSHLHFYPQVNISVTSPESENKTQRALSFAELAPKISSADRIKLLKQRLALISHKTGEETKIVEKSKDVLRELDKD